MNKRSAIQKGLLDRNPFLKKHLFTRVFAAFIIVGAALGQDNWRKVKSILIQWPMLFYILVSGKAGEQEVP